jgi:hypothetical protein
MKRFISIILVFILALAAVGCSNKPVSEANATEAPKATEAAFTEEPALTTEPAETPEATEEPAFTEEPSEEPTPIPTAMPERPEEYTNLPKVIAGKDVFFITYPDGSLYAWGNNGFGQLGVGDTESRAEPVLMANGLVPVIVGETVFALSSDNILWGWGRNDYGQLGTGDRENRSRPVELMHFVKGVVKGRESFYALTESGEVYVWGLDPVYANYVDVDLSGICEPRLLFDNVKWLDGNYIIKTDGGLWQDRGGEWRLIANGVRRIWRDLDTIAFEGTDGRLYTLGDREGLIGSPDEGRRLVAESFRSVTVSDGTIWVLTDDGSLLYYKAAYSNLLGSEEGFDELTFVMNEVVEFAADAYMDEDWGYDYKFALKANGDLWAWGEYSEPALGKTEMSLSYEPECVAHGVRSFVSTGAQTYIIAEDGSVWATGYGPDDVFFYGSLGDGTEAARYGFTYLGVEGFCTVTSRMDMEYVTYDDETDTVVHYCRTFAVDAEGRIFAWGWNGDGFLGTGSNEKLVLSPEEIVIED